MRKNFMGVYFSFAMAGGMAAVRQASFPMIAHEKLAGFADLTRRLGCRRAAESSQK
jgi:hypothetical protein